VAEPATSGLRGPSPAAAIPTTRRACRSRGLTRPTASIHKLEPYTASLAVKPDRGKDAGRDEGQRVNLPMTVMWSACRETDDAAGSPAHSVGRSMVTTFAPLLLDFAGTSGIFVASRTCGATVQREGLNVPGSTAVRVSMLDDALGPLVGRNDPLDEAPALTLFFTGAQSAPATDGQSQSSVSLQGSGVSLRSKARGSRDELSPIELKQAKAQPVSLIAHSEVGHANSNYHTPEVNKCTRR
jgi:hypothetical protein